MEDNVTINDFKEDNNDLNSKKSHNYNYWLLLMLVYLIFFVFFGLWFGMLFTWQTFH